MHLNVQEASNRTGISPHAIRYYERSGILPRVTRGPGGARQFSGADLDSLRMIANYKRSGLSLAEIKVMVKEIVEYGCIHEPSRRGVAAEQSHARRLQLLREHRQRLVKQQKLLERMITDIDQKIKLFEGRLGARSGVPIDVRRW